MLTGESFATYHVSVRDINLSYRRKLSTRFNKSVFTAGAATFSVTHHTFLQ